MSRIWSPQQLGIFGWFEGDVAAVASALLASGLAADMAEAIVKAKALIVRARAGTGKTTTILEAVHRAPEQRILVAAFNASIKDELARRNQNPNVEAKTLHGVGFAHVRRYWEGVNVCRPERLRVDALVDEVCGGQVPDAVRRLVGKLCTNGREIVPHAAAWQDLLDVAQAHECVPDEEWEDAGFSADFVCARALDAMVLAAEKKPKDGIDYADMLYLPVRNGWLRKMWDLVVVDEAQDMTVTQLEIAVGSCTGRMCVVGDDRQAIYGFRGADSDSLDRLKAELKAAELGLTTTYRCGRVIAERAAVLVPDFEAAPTNHEGEIVTGPTIEGLAKVAEPGDWVLSRTNAPLVKVAMALLRSNKRARVMGRDVGAGLKALAKKLMTGKASQSIPALLERLARWEERELERASTAKNADTLSEAIRDKAETLRVIVDGVTGPREMEARLDHLFSDDPEAAAVTCSSVHKAKGREAERVFVLRDTLCPTFKRDKPVDPTTAAKRAREEANIEYVAVTRAIRTLVWVSGK